MTEASSVNLQNVGRAPNGQSGVAAVLKHASARTGVDFGYLYNVAVRESSLDANARARTSSATGLFQFIDQTWLAAVKKYGRAHGMANEAAQIERSASGVLSVADKAERQRILDLRFDAEKSAALAGELANENRAYLEQKLGRAVSNAEIYAAHFLGANGAAKLLSGSADANAAELLPAAARANRNVFFDGDRARSVAEIVSSFAKTIGGEVRTIVDNVAPTVSPARSEATLKPAHPPAAEAPRISLTRGALNALSPLAIAVLQALDPTRIARRD